MKSFYHYYSLCALSASAVQYGPPPICRHVRDDTAVAWLGRQHAKHARTKLPLMSSPCTTFPHAARVRRVWGHPNFEYLQAMQGGILEEGEDADSSRIMRESTPNLSHITVNILDIMPTPSAHRTPAFSNLGVSPNSGHLHCIPAQPTPASCTAISDVALSSLLL